MRQLGPADEDDTPRPCGNIIRVTQAALEAHPGHLTTIGALAIHRALPVRGRRRIGP